MSQGYKPFDRDLSFLLPPSMREWLPEGDLAWFVIDLMETLDRSAFYRYYEEEKAPSGQPPYPPKRMGGAGGVCLRERDGEFAEDRAAVRAGHRLPGGVGRPAAELPDDLGIPADSPESTEGAVRAGAASGAGVGSGDAGARGAGRDEGEGERLEAQGDELRAEGREGGAIRP